MNEIATLSKEATEQLRRRQRRPNWILMLVLLAFVAATFELSFTHVQNESQAPAAITVQ